VIFLQEFLIIVAQYFNSVWILEYYKAVKYT